MKEREVKNRKYGDGKSVHGIGEKKRSEVKVTQSCLTLRPHGLYSPWNSPGQSVQPPPFSRGSSQPRDRAQISLTAGGFLTS